MFEIDDRNQVLPTHSLTISQAAGGPVTNELHKKRPVDEAKVLKGAIELKSKIIEVGSILSGADTYEDYLQDIVNDFDQTYKSSAKLFAPIVDDPSKASPELSSFVLEVVRGVEGINKSFEQFAKGQVNFDKFKDIYITIVAKIGGIPDPVLGSKTNQEQANIPKRQNLPVSNMDMNSFVSAELNRKAAEDDGDINIPEDFGNSPGEEFIPPVAVGKSQFVSPEAAGFDSLQPAPTNMRNKLDDEDDGRIPDMPGTMFGFGDKGDDDGWGRVVSSPQPRHDVPIEAPKKTETRKPAVPLRPVSSQPISNVGFDFAMSQNKHQPAVIEEEFSEPNPPEDLPIPTFDFDPSQQALLCAYPIPAYE